MKPTESIKVQSKQYPAELLSLEPGKVNLNTVPAIQLLHEQSMAKRRRDLAETTEDMFPLTCLEDLPVDEDVPADEAEAELVVSHKRIVILDREFNAIHGHETVLKAQSQRGATVIVLRITVALERRDIFLIKVRHAAKEGMLFPAIRMEAIRILHDVYELSVKEIQLLLVGPNGKKPSQKEVTSELNVGRLFEKYPGYVVPFRGYELDKHSFSNLKYLVGNRTIFDEMSSSPDQERHFLHMAIAATKARSKRLNTDIPPLMKHEDTKKLLFRDGLLPAKELLRVKYPEESFEHHPQSDLVSANAKLKRTDTLLLVKKQLDAGVTRNPLFLQVIELLETMSEISPVAKKEIMRTLMNQSPKEYADILTESHPDVAAQSIVGAKTRLTGLIRAIL